MESRGAQTKSHFGHLINSPQKFSFAVIPQLLQQQLLKHEVIFQSLICIEGLESPELFSKIYNRENQHIQATCTVLSD